MSLTTAFVLVVIALLFLGSMVHPVSGVLGYIVVYLLLNYYAWWAHPIFEYLHRPSFIAMIFLTLGCIIHFRKLNWSFSRKEIVIYLFAITAWIVTHYFGVLFDAGTEKFLTKLFKMFIFLFLFFRVVSTMERVKIVIWTIILCGIFLAYQGHVSGDLSTGRLENLGSSDFTEANALGAFIVSCITLLGFKLFKSSVFNKVLYVFGIALMADAFILTQSRAVFLGIVFMVPSIIVMMPKLYKKQLWLYLFLAMMLFLMIGNQSFFNRMGTIDTTVDESFNENSLFVKETLNRVDFWRASIQIFKDHPMGIGVNNFANIVPRYDPRNPGMDPHNTYVLCYSEIGIIGIILFLFIVFYSFVELRKVKTFVENNSLGVDIQLICISLMGVLIMYCFGSSMTHSNLYTEILWIYLALPTCLVNGAKQMRNSINTA